MKSTHRLSITPEGLLLPDPKVDAQTILALATPSGKEVFLPTAEQKQIVEASPEPLLVVAGAGAGKTATMSMRVLWLVANQGISPDAILGLTFSRKSAGELGAKMRTDLKTLADRIGGHLEGEPTSLTYNAFAQRLVLEHGMRIGLDPDLTLIGRARAVALMSQIVDSWPTRLPDTVSGRQLVKDALAMAGHIGEHGMDCAHARTALEDLGHELEEIGAPTSTLKKMREVNEERIFLLDIIDEFDKQKRRCGVIDYSDQLVLATRIVTSCDDVVEQVRQEHRAVLLDEFQDTSVIQMTLLSTLFHDHPVTAVGDPNQAIYGWRGASASSLESFLQRFVTQREPRRDQTKTLSQAWRNDRRILVAANAVAEPLRRHSTHAKSPRLLPREKAGVGRVEIVYETDRPRQMKRLVDFVERTRKFHDGQWSTAAVLCRRRRDFVEVERALRDAGIPTYISELGGLLQQPAVADVRAALELAADPSAAQWLPRLLLSMDLGSRDISFLGAWAQHCARSQTRGDNHAHAETILLSAVDAPPPIGWLPEGKEGQGFSAEAHERVLMLSRRLRAIREGRDRTVPDQVERAIRIMGMVEDLLADPMPNRGRECLDAFIDIALQHESEVPGADLRAFLQWLSLAEEEEEGLPQPARNPAQGAVHIMTVHGAKGLEWDSVAVVAMGDSIFPSHKSNSVSWTSDPVPSSAWITARSELPYPLRGDAADLPPLVEELDDYGDLATYFHEKAAHAQSKRSTPSSLFNAHVKDVARPNFGAHAEREERRLAYVALTRARHDMLLIGSWIDTGAKTKEPSRYLMEARKALSDLFADTPHDMDEVRRQARGEGSQEELRDEYAELKQSIVPAPTEEEIDELAVEGEYLEYPLKPGPSRQRIQLSADRVRRALAQMPTSGDVAAELEDLAEDPLVRDTIALLEEQRVRSSRQECVSLDVSRLAATAVQRLLSDPAEFAAHLRRPMPTRPRSSSLLGTVFHQWVETELHLSTGTLWDVECAGMESLDERERERFALIQRNFRDLDLLRTHDVVAIEEAFSVNIAGVFVQGRIDAVLRDKHGRDTVVDWKSGRVIGPQSDSDTLAYYATQLHLYRQAWARRRRCPVEHIGARVVFLAAPAQFSLEEIEAMLAQRHACESDLRERVARAVNTVNMKGHAR